jgi:hypothetical protein
MVLKGSKVEIKLGRIKEEDVDWERKNRERTPRGHEGRSRSVPTDNVVGCPRCDTESTGQDGRISYGLDELGSVPCEHLWGQSRIVGKEAGRKGAA